MMHRYYNRMYNDVRTYILDMSGIKKYMYLHITNQQKNAASIFSCYFRK